MFAVGFSFFGLDDEVQVVTWLILGLACVDALTEPLPLFSRVLEPFRKNFLTRLIAGSFAPGWISGIGFFFVCLFIAGAFFVLGGSPRPVLPWSSGFDLADWTGFFSMGNLLIFPLLFIHLFFGKQTSGHFTFAIYCFMQACLLVITAMVMVLASTVTKYEDAIYLSVPLPSVLLFATMNGEAKEFIHFAIALVTTAVSTAIPLLCHRADFRDFQQNLKRA